MPEKKLDVRLSVKADGSAERAKRAVEGVGKAAKKAADEGSRSMERLQTRMQSVGEVAERLSGIGATVAGVGAAITGPLLLAANSYIQAAGRAEEQSRRWLMAQERLVKSGQDIGRVVVQEAIPYLEKAANLAEKTARFVEEHPGVINAALQIGTVTAGLGALLMVAGTITKTASDVGLLYAQLAPALTKIGPAISGALTKLAPILGVGGAIAGGLGAGAVGFEALARTDVGQAIGAKEGTSGKALSLVAFALGSLVGKGDEAFKAVAEWTGQLEKTTEVAREASDVAVTMQAQVGAEVWGTAIEGYQTFQEANTAALEQHEAQRVAVVDQFGQQRADAEARYEGQRADIIADFAESQARVLRNFQRRQAEAASDFARERARDAEAFARDMAQADADYYAQRALRARDFGVETQRMEEDHQRSMARLREDFLGQVQNAAIDRDAIALRQATKGYEQQRGRAEQDFQVQAGRRNSDYARQIADQERAFQVQRGQRQADFERQQREAQENYDRQQEQRLMDFELQRQDAQEAHTQRLADLDVAHQEQQAQSEAQHQQDLQDLDAQYQAEKQLRSSAFNEQLTDLDAALTGQQAAAKAKYAAMEVDFKAYLNNLQTSLRPPAPRGRAGGRPGAVSPRGSSSGRTSARGGRQAGGYANAAGRYTLGEGGREFVLNNPTTRRMESAVGRPLTQGAFGGGLGGITVQANVSGMGMTPAAVAAIAGRQVEAQLLQVLTDAGRQT